MLTLASKAQQLVNTGLQNKMEFSANLPRLIVLLIFHSRLLNPLILHPSCHHCLQGFLRFQSLFFSQMKPCCCPDKIQHKLGEWVKWDTLNYKQGKLSFTGYHSGSKSNAFSIGGNRWNRANMAGVSSVTCLRKWKKPFCGGSGVKKGNRERLMFFRSHLRM